MEIKLIDLTEGKPNMILEFARKAFLEYLGNHLNEELYIIIPPKCNIENYVFSLESTMMHLYNVSITNKKFHYIFGNNLIEELPTCIDSVILDPVCFLYECNRLNDIIQEIREKVINE